MNAEQQLEPADKLVHDGKPSLAIDNTDALRHNTAVVAELEMEFARGNPCPLWTAWGMLNKDALDMKQRRKLGELYGMNATEIKKAFDALERKDKISQELGSVPENEYEFVYALLKKWQTVMWFNKTYRISTPYEVLDGDAPVFEEELATFDKQLQVIIRSSDPKTTHFGVMLAKVIKASAVMKMGYGEQQIIRAFEDWTLRRQNAIVGTAKGLVAYHAPLIKPAEAEWDKLVAAITHTSAEETKVVLKHFLWQIKRKMHGKRVDHHMMPVLSGKQGIGKSTIVKKLISPVEEFSITTNFKDITDGRSHDLWKNYVLILDEMGNSTQSNIEEIKQKITSDTFSSRIMKTNTDAVIFNNTTMIGTTNRHLSTLIFDDTGMRRFFQIACRDDFDQAAVNAVNYGWLWRSIDEEAASPLFTNMEVYRSIQTIQDGARFRGTLEQFFRQRTYIGGEDGETLDASDLYDEFRSYEEVNDRKEQMSSTKFFRDMVNIPGKIPGFGFVKLPRKNNHYRYKLWMEGELE